MRLRRRLNTVLLQWFLLFATVATSVWILFLPGVRKNLADDRLLIARAIAQSLDATISASIQSLGQLAGDLPASADQAAARLHAFRLQSQFSDATYLLNSQGDVIAADPSDVPPLPASALGSHESVTSVIHKSSGRHAVMAIVQPFTRGDQGYYLVSEMNPLDSKFSQFLRELKADPAMHIAVVDEHGVVLASADPASVLKTLGGAEELTERIRSHRPLVEETRPAGFTEPAVPTLAVMAPLRFASWGVLIEQPVARAFSGLRATSRGLLLTGLGLVVMGALLARTLSRSVVSPIRRLSAQAAAMRGGNLAAPIAVSGDYEIEMLAKSLDEARAKLKATLEELQAFNVRLEEQVEARTKTIVQQDEQRKVLVRRMLGATEDERRRLARELHDEIAQLLTVIQLSLDNANVDTPEMRRASELLVRTQQEIHRIIYDLRPSLLDDLGLSAAMESYAQDHLSRADLRVHLDIEEGLPSRPEIETVIFRIYQELVTNVLRHSGAEQVSVELYLRDGTLVLRVEDDGCGFDPEAKSEGAGLTGMRERAALVNGTIRFDSAPGVGTQVTVEIPLQ